MVGQNERHGHPNLSNTYRRAHSTWPWRRPLAFWARPSPHTGAGLLFLLRSAMGRRWRKSFNDVLCRRDLSPAAKLVYEVLSDRIGTNGTCWPGCRRLADDIGVNRGTVIDAIRQLEAVGLIVVERQPNGRSNRYSLGNGQPPEPMLPGIDLKKRPENPAGSRPAGKSNRPENPTPGGRKTRPLPAGKPGHNQIDQLNQKKNKSRAPKNDGFAKELAEYPSLDTDEFRKTWAEWVQYRKEIRHALKPSTVTRQLAKLDIAGPAKAKAMIEQSIENGWTGLFDPREPPERTRAEVEAETEEYRRKMKELEDAEKHGRGPA